MENREERIQRLLEQIDPGIRLKKLEDQKKQLEDRFLDIMSQTDSQRSLVERHRKEYEEKTNKDEKSYAKRMVEASEESLQQSETFLEFVVEQLEDFEEKIAELKGAGTGKKKGGNKTE